MKLLLSGVTAKNWNHQTNQNPRLGQSGDSQHEAHQLIGEMSDDNSPQPL
ncbi:hypothetical protein [Moorena sp. SIO3H5]|nr:hypothetical protein [Moorena sp. SIO3H5]NEO70236.1 hypothetical protein [Moorena sp. SIO3H5]